MRRAILLAGRSACCSAAATTWRRSRSRRAIRRDVGPRGTSRRTVEFRDKPVQAPPVTLALLERGQERFRIYCTPCHSELGDGHGMIVQRGFPPPPSYHIDRLRQAPVQHFYDVITNGYGAMYSFAERVQPADRWAIAAYIRALQRSQNAKLADVPPDQQGSTAMTRRRRGACGMGRRRRRPRSARWSAGSSHRAAFPHAWLAAVTVWMGWPLGSMALLLIHALTGGRWG